MEVRVVHVVEPGDEEGDSDFLCRGTMRIAFFRDLGRGRGRGREG